MRTPNCEDRGNLTPHRAIIKVLNMAQYIQLYDRAIDDRQKPAQKLYLYVLENT